MMKVLRHRVYSHLFGSLVCSLLGSGLATVALGLVSYDIAGADASAVLGAIFTVKMIAYVVIAPLANAAVARLPRRAVMVGSDCLRLAAALCLPFVDAIWQIFALVFVLQAASAVFTPTFQSVVPAVLPDEDDYTNALSLARLAEDLETIVSPMLAAALLLVVRADALFFGTAIGFAASALLVLSAAIPHGLGITTDDDEEPFGTRARVGIELFFRTPGTDRYWWSPLRFSDSARASVLGRWGRAAEGFALTVPRERAAVKEEFRATPVGLPEEFGVSSDQEPGSSVEMGDVIFNPIPRPRSN